MALLRNRDQLSIAEQLPIVKKSRQLTPQVYRQFTTALLSNQPIAPELHHQIVLLLDEIKIGSICIIPDDSQNPKSKLSAF